MRVFEYKLLTAGDMSDDINTPSQSLTQMQLASVQAVWTGSPVGTFKLQISNDDPKIVDDADIVWSDYTGSSTMITTAGNFIWNMTGIGFNLVRLIYVFAGGTGSLDVTVSGKGP